MRCRFTWVILAALAAPMAITEVLPPPDDAAESALLKAVNALCAGDFNAGFNGTQGLVRHEPNFRLAQLIYSELLAVRSGVKGATPLTHAFRVC